MKFLLSLFIIGATELDTLWVFTRGGETGSDRFTDIIITQSGYMVMGAQQVSGIMSNMWALDLDRDGNLVWERTYGGDTLLIYLGGVARCGNGFVFTGGIYGNSHDGWIFRTDENGDVIWEKLLSTQYSELIYSVRTDSLNNIVAAGYTPGVVPGSDDNGWVFKYDEDGNYIWSVSFGDTADEFFLDADIDQNGDVIAVGLQRTGGKDDLLIVKLRGTDGAILWYKTYGGAYDDWGYKVRTDQQGYYIIAGYTVQDTVSFADAWLLKVDPQTGDTIWTRVIGADSSTQIFFSVGITPLNNYLAVGYTDEEGDEDMYIAKFSPAGETLFSSILPQPGAQELLDVAIDPDSAYYILAGVDQNLDNNYFKGTVLKFRGEFAGIIEKPYSSQREMITLLKAGTIFDLPADMYMIIDNTGRVIKKEMVRGKMKIFLNPGLYFFIGRTHRFKVLLIK